MYIIESLKELIKVEIDFLESIKQKEESYLLFNNNEIFHLSVNIIERIKLTQQDILKDDYTLIKLYASLRYILETLIQTELLLIEPDYTFKLFYSIYNHQLDKTKKLIQRIEKEILIMDKYEAEDKKITDNSIKTIKQADNELAMKKHSDDRVNLDDQADLEYTMFCGNFKWLGYGLTKSHLEKIVLPEYKKRLQLFEKAQKEIAKKLIKENHISKLFDFRNQYSRVFGELKEKRSWQKKATVVGLEDEYDLIYDLSSAILHSTSYSYGTNVNTTENEIEMVLSLCFKYSKKIMINIDKYSNMAFYQKIITVNITNEE
ncbi:hypothetical protein EV144_104337 [Flavobacterium sp. 270]|uniref:hypothetical protein n=1 Tax=Flavobacterium sp. 270 TaxID=2512114 RepID=UPI001065052D|nr:hypothetical protein [Flavobacterium sp. 270]TDW48051.1 hypothetical protein EV144_104337 [Flavobacterium sp. 270]